MFTLSMVLPAVFSSVAAHNIPEHYQAAYQAYLKLALDGVAIDAERACDPRVLIERDANGFFFRLELRFKKAGHDMYTYTFETTINPSDVALTAESREVLVTLPVNAREPVLSVAFEATRNGIVYYTESTTGSVKAAAAYMQLALRG